MEEIELKDNVNIDVTFGFIHSGKKKILVINAIGEYGIGSSGNNNGNYLSAMIAAACMKWKFNAIIFNFEKLKYEMSDSLGSIFSTVQRMRSANFEISIITSGQNEKSILSLLDMLKLREKVNVEKK